MKGQINGIENTQLQSSVQPRLRAGKPRKWYEKLMREEPGFEKKREPAPEVKKERMQQSKLSELVNFFSLDRGVVSDKNHLAEFNKINGYELAQDDLREILRASATKRTALLLELLRIAKSDNPYGPFRLSQANVAVVLGEAVEQNCARNDAIQYIIMDFKCEEPRLDARITAKLLLKFFNKPSGDASEVIECIKEDIGREVPRLGRENIDEILAEAAKYKENSAEIIGCLYDDMKRKTPKIETGKILETQIVGKVEAGDMPAGVLLKYSKGIGLEKIKAAIEERYQQVKKRVKDYGKFDEKWVSPGMGIGFLFGTVGLPIVYAETTYGWSWWGVAGNAILGLLGGTGVGAGIGALAGAITIPLKASFQTRKDKKLSRAWLGWLKKKEGENNTCENTKQKAPVLETGKILDILILEHIEMGNMPTAAMLKRAIWIDSKKIKEAVKEKYKIAKIVEKDFIGFGKGLVVPLAGLGILPGVIIWNIVMEVHWPMNNWNWMEASIVGALVGAAIGAGLGFVADVGMNVLIFFGAMKERKKLKKAWLGGLKEMEGESNG